MLSLTLPTRFFLINIIIANFLVLLNTSITAARIAENNSISDLHVQILSSYDIDDADLLEKCCFRNSYQINETCDESICRLLLSMPKNRTIFRKCCERNEYFDDETMCRIDPVERFANIEREQSSNFRFVYGQPCPHLIFPEESFNFSPYGYLTVDTFDGKFTEFNSCLEFMNVNDFVSLRPALCFDGDYREENEEPRYAWFFWGMLLSVVTLMLTFTNYLFLRALRRKFRTKCLLCHIFALILGYSSLIVVQSGPTNAFVCFASAYLTQFGFLACFFWLNVMCVDLWLVSRIAAPRHASVKTFAMYCVYAWGCPLLVSIFTALVDSSIIPYKFIKPNFGTQLVCFFIDQQELDFWKDPKFWFFYLYTSVLLVVNTCIFVKVAWFLFVKNNEWDSSKSKGSARHRKRSKNTFVLYLKLFLIMGVSWIAEVMTYYFKQLPKYMCVLDGFNTFQGVVIFLLFCANDNVIYEWKKIFFPKRTLLSRNTSTSRIIKLSIRDRSTTIRQSRSYNAKIDSINHRSVSVSNTEV